MPRNFAQEWSGLVQPWRDVAEQLGFRLVDRRVELVRRDEHNCFDVLQDSQGTWLDLMGVLGEVQGFWSATCHTWVDLDDTRQHLWNVGELDPPPMPPDAAGGFLAKLARPLLRAMVPAAVRAARMKSPGDLVAVIERHRERVRASGGKPWRGDRPAAT